MAAYPIMLNLAGRLAVVVGGGTVGRRKVDGLLACGARVRVVDPALTGDWPAGVEQVALAYEARHLHDARLVFACTDNPRINARVSADAQAGGAWVNVADDPGAGDFTLPAVHRWEGIIVAVGTVAGTPALAMAVRDALVQALPAGAESFALALAGLREKLRAAEPDRHRRHRILRRIGGPEGMLAFQQGGLPAMEQLMTEDVPSPRDSTPADGG